MEKKFFKQQKFFVSEEEKILKWDNVLNSFEETFGSEIFNSWLKDITLIKEYNDYLVLGVPTRFFRDWMKKSTKTTKIK